MPYGAGYPAINNVIMDLIQRYMRGGREDPSYAGEHARPLDELYMESLKRYGAEGLKPVESKFGVPKGKPGKAIEISGEVNETPGSAAEKMRAILAQGGRPSDIMAAEMLREREREEAYKRRKSDLLKPRPTMGPGGISMQVDPRAAALFEALEGQDISRIGAEAEASLAPSRANALDAQAAQSLAMAQSMLGSGGGISPSTQVQIFSRQLKAAYDNGSISQADYDMASRALMMGDLSTARQIIMEAGGGVPGQGGAAPGDLVYGVDF